MSEAEPRLFEVETTFTVGELAGRIARTIRTGFPGEIWVKGQIRNLSGSRAGHRYFDLVDPVPAGREPDAAIPVVLFDSNRQIVNRVLKRAGAPRIEDGVEIRIRGELDFYARQGRTQIRMTGVDAEYTLGKLAADRQRLIAELQAAGLLDRNRQLAIPPVPLRVGLVTSAGGAAAADFVAQLEASGHAFRVSLVDTQVQGLGADVSIVGGLRRACRHGVDVVALVRGGGSRTDLSPFDTRAVAMAIAGAQVPVVTGIGHETDQAVADLVAHTSVKTPTACAQLLVERVDGYVSAIHDCWIRVEAAASAGLRNERQHINRIGAAAVVSTKHALSGADRRAAEASRQLGREARRICPVASQRLAEVAERVRLLDPQHTLARGWSITRDADGRVLRSAADVSPEDTLFTQLTDGVVESVVSRPAEDAGS